MTRSLKVGKTLSLPLAWMQLATVVYGARGSGKTMWGSVMAEEITEHKQRFVAIDPKGDWYGLRSSADGKSEGIPVVIFGGDHADLPLEDGAGKWLGETVAKLDQSVILDLEHLSKTKQRKLVADFFEALYHHNREPLAVFVDEAQRFAPQAGGRGIDPEVARCLGAVEDLIKMGRKHGIGPVLFTQRGAGLSKEVSEVCDLLVVFRTPGPLDQERVKDWLDANATKTQRDEVIGTKDHPGILASLETGTAMFASGHPKLELFGVHKVRMRWTFDSSATPEIGKPRKEPKKLAKPDLDELKQQMEVAIKRIEAEDPKKLRMKIAELEKQIQKFMTDKQERANAKLPPPRNIEIQVPVFDEQEIKALNEAVVSGFGAIDSRISQVRTDLRNALYSYRDRCRSKAKTKPVRRETKPTIHETIRLQRDTIRSPSPPNGASLNGSPLGKCPRALLTAIIQRHPKASTLSQIAILSRYSVKSSSFQQGLSALRVAGLIEGGASTGGVSSTEAGLAALPNVPELPSGQDLLEYWKGFVGKCPAALLQVLADSFPSPVTKEELADKSGYSLGSSSFQQGMSKLRVLELMVGRGEDNRANDELFVEE